jgi:hypothetical protein
MTTEGRWTEAEDSSQSELLKLGRISLLDLIEAIEPFRATLNGSQGYLAVVSALERAKAAATLIRDSARSQAAP